jgi:hypothetical protein
MRCKHSDRKSLLSNWISRMWYKNSCLNQRRIPNVSDAIEIGPACWPLRNQIPFKQKCLRVLISGTASDNFGCVLLGGITFFFMKVCLQEVITHCQSSPGTPPCSTSTLLGRTGNGRVIYTRGQSALRWKNKTQSREWSRRRRRQTNITKPDEHLFIGGREKTTFRLKRHQLHEKTKMTKRNQSTTAGSRLVFGHSDRFTLG